MAKVRRKNHGGCTSGKFKPKRMGKGWLATNAPARRGRSKKKKVDLLDDGQADPGQAVDDQAVDDQAVDGQAGEGQSDPSPADAS